MIIKFKNYIGNDVMLIFIKRRSNDEFQFKLKVTTTEKQTKTTKKTRNENYEEKKCIYHSKQNKTITVVRKTNLNAETKLKNDI